MNTYRADLHIHTILSPCGDLQMSPENIIREASKKSLDVIGITDHNSTRQAKLIRKLGEQNGIFVLCGAEVTTKEEAHCLCFMPNDETLDQFQEFLDANLPDIKNDVDNFGYQVCVDENEDIIYQEDRLLISGINKSIDEIEIFVHKLGGVFIPAHVNRAVFSIISQLGFVSPDLKIDALGLSRHTSKHDFLKDHKYLENYTFIKSSDAHFVNDIGVVFSEFIMKSRNFEEFKLALNNSKGRKVNI